MWNNKTGRTASAQHKRWRMAVLNRDSWTCQLRYNGCEITANIADHKIAVAFGGTNSLANGQAVCSHCHTIKTQAEAQHARAKRSRRRSPEDHPGLL